MTPYLVTLLLAVAMTWAGRRSRNAVIRRGSIGATVALLTLFAGLRNWTVGTDTGNYVEMFSLSTSSADIWQTTEIGYNAFMRLCALISNDYAILLTMSAFLVVSSYISVIVRTTKRYETAVFLFITLGTYTFFFNGARQGIATALCFLALPYLLARRREPYFVIIALAALFHHTALIAAPLYFLATPRTSWWHVAGVICGSIVLVIFLATFVQIASLLLDDKYAVYAEVGEGGGRLMVAFLVSQGIILFALKNQVVDPDRSYRRLLNIYLIGLVPAVAATVSNINPSGLLRLSTYFSHVALLLWPMVFWKLNNSASRGLAAMIFFFTALTFFLLTTSSFSDLVPYQINPEFAL